MGRILRLNAEQREQAEELLSQIEQREISKPQDINLDWNEGPTLQEIHTQWADGGKEGRKRQWVEVSRVRGVMGDGEDNKSRTDHLKPIRFRRTLERMLNGKFKLKYNHKPPKYIEYQGELYVTTDGRHRTIACKIFDVDEIWGAVNEPP